MSFESRTVNLSMHRWWSSCAILCLALAACGGNSNHSNVRIVDPDGVSCVTTDGATFTCPIDPSVVEANDLTSTDLSDYVSALANDGITEDSVLLIQAYGGGSKNPTGGDVKDGVAQTVTSVADFQANYGTTVLYLYVGLEANTSSEVGETTAGGGSSTIVATVDGATEATAFDISSNVIAIAGGGGGGGNGDVNHDNEGEGGAGGVAISSQPGDGNCAISGNDDDGAVCGAGSDGTSGSQHSHDATDPGKGGSQGVGGSGKNDGKSGIGGLGGAPYNGSAVGWAGGYSPAFSVSENLGNGGGGAHEQGDPCAGTDKDNWAFGGGGGGGYGGGGGGGAQETCPASDTDFVTLGGGGGGGGSFAIVSTESYSGSYTASATTGDGQVVLVFIGSSDD